MMVNIAHGMAELGVAVDFVVDRASNPYLSEMSAAVRVVELGELSGAGARSRLAAYIDTEGPVSLLSGKHDDDRLALAACELSINRPRVFFMVGSPPSARHRARRVGPLRRWRDRRRLTRLFQHADAVICASRGIAQDVADLTGLGAERLPVLPNPVVGSELPERCRDPVDHPWFDDGGSPVILAAGGLRRAKNFPLLIRSFARVLRARRCRLVILGEGRQRQKLASLIRSLKIADSVSLPGFVANPYAYMARASLFVLSSDFEGFGNVLVEAMACGTPVVSTDCDCGPREILAGGEYGRLVPVGDEAGLAAAIEASLSVPPDRERFEQAVQPYRLRTACLEYARVLGAAVT